MRRSEIVVEVEKVETFEGLDLLRVRIALEELQSNVF